MDSSENHKSATVLMKPLQEKAVSHQRDAATRRDCFALRKSKQVWPPNKISEAHSTWCSQAIQISRFFENNPTTNHSCCFWREWFPWLTSSPHLPWLKHNTVHPPLCVPGAFVWNETQRVELWEKKISHFTCQKSDQLKGQLGEKVKAPQLDALQNFSDCWSYLGSDRLFFNLFGQQTK